MLARTASLAIVASLAAVVVASPLPGGGDGQDIKFIEIKAINDDRFKKTNFNDSHLPSRLLSLSRSPPPPSSTGPRCYRARCQLQPGRSQGQGHLEGCRFKKNDNDFGIFKRGVDIGLLGDDSSFGFFPFGVDDGFGLDSGLLGDDSLDISIFKGGLDTGFGDSSFVGSSLLLGLDQGFVDDSSVSSRSPFPPPLRFSLDSPSLKQFFGGLLCFKRGLDSCGRVGLAKRWDRDGEDIKFAEIKAIDEDEFKKTNFNVHDRTEHDKNFNQVEAKDRDVLKATAFRKNDDDEGFKHRRFREGKFGDDW